MWKCRKSNLIRINFMTGEDHEYSSACPFVSPRHESSQDPIFHPKTMSQRAPTERPSTDGGGWGSAGSLWPNKSTKGCFWEGEDWIKSGRKKKKPKTITESGWMEECWECAVRETARSSTIEISTCLHFCSGCILLRPLWRALTQLSQLTASEHYPPAHKGPPRPSAEPWKGGKSKTEGMSEKKVSNEEQWRKRKLGSEMKGRRGDDGPFP